VEPVSQVSGRMAPLDRADVDTDQIIPKQFLKRIERTGYGPFLFFDWRADGNFVLDKPEHKGASVLVTGANFGCGSSREHELGAARFRFQGDHRAEDPASPVTVDLEKQEVRGDGFTYKFSVDAFARECMLGGLDEIGLVERHGPDIGAYESHRQEWLPAVK